MNCLPNNNTSLWSARSSALSRILSGYRSFFYLRSPSETSFAKVEDVPNYVDSVSNFNNSELYAETSL